VVATVGAETVARRNATVTLDGPADASLTATNGTDVAGNQIVVEYRLESNESSYVEDASIDVAAEELPVGWRIADVQTGGFAYYNGGWDSSTTTLNAPLDGAGDVISARLTLQLPANASPGVYRLPAEATVAGTAVDTATATATVERTANATVTATNGSDVAGNQVTLEYRLASDEPGYREHAEIDVTGVPDNWSIADVQTSGFAYYNGGWNESATALRAPLDSEGDVISARLTLELPADAHPGEYVLPATARIGAERVGSTTATATVERTANATLSTTDDLAVAGGSAVVEYRLESDDPGYRERAAIDLAPLPPGWQVADVRTSGFAYYNGGWNESATALRAPLDSEGNAISARLTLDVPSNATPGTRPLPATATIGAETVATRNATVSVPGSDSATLATGNDTDVAGNPIRVRYRLTSDTAGTVRDVALAVGPLPDNWTVVDTGGNATWNASALRATGTLEREGDAVVATVAVRPPASAPAGDYRVPAVATAGDARIAAGVATASVTDDPSVSLSTTNATVGTNGSVSLLFEVENGETATLENATLDVGAVPDPLTVTDATTLGAVDGSYDRGDRRLVAPLSGQGDTHWIRLDVAVPPNATAGTYRVPVTASVADTTVGTRTATVRVLGDGSVRLATANATALAGTDVRVAYEVESTTDGSIGAVEAPLALPAGWSVSYVPEPNATGPNATWRPFATSLEGSLPTRGDRLRVNLTLEPPANASGTVRLPVAVRAAGGTLTRRPLTVRLESGEAVNATLSTSNVTVPAGGQVEVSSRLRTTESYPLEDVHLDAGRLPPGWSAGFFFPTGDRTWYNGTDLWVNGTVTPDGDPLGFDVDLQVPANASPGTYRIPVTATAAGEPFVREEIVVRVTDVDTELSVQAGNTTGGDRVAASFVVTNFRTQPVDATVDVGTPTAGWTLTDYYVSDNATWNATETTASTTLAAAGSGDGGDQLFVGTEFAVPANQSPGRYRVPVTFEVDGNRTTRNATVTVERTPNVTVSGSATEVYNGTANLTYTLRNDEAYRLEGVSLDVQTDRLPANWSITAGTVSPGYAGTWNATTASASGSAYESLSVELAVDVPSTADGDATYTVPVVASVGDRRLGTANATVSAGG
jgi:uncharacterized membrane protein